MKLLLIPEELSNLESYIDRGCNGIIIGLKDLSTNYDVVLALNQIKILREKYPSIEIFIAMNKNFFNEELPKVEESLKELDKININGVLYYDLSVVYLRNKNNLKLVMLVLAFLRSYHSSISSSSSSLYPPARPPLYCQRVQA